MSRFYSYLNSSASILQLYKGAEPFSIFLKAQFAQHKKFGSRDRKEIAHLCYCYFRLGQALLQVPIEERILTGLFLNEQQPNELLRQLKPDWNELIALPADAKANMLEFSVHDIFPWRDELSNGIDAGELSTSFLIQPDVFLRLRPGKEALVKRKLREASIPFNPVSHTCLSINNSVNLDNVINLDEEAVVQDYNSQRVGEFLDCARPSAALSTQDRPSTALKVYDCCAASGGKSILAFDVLKNIKLTVTDIRESILANLRKRFARAGIKKYEGFAIDLTSNINSQTVSSLKSGSIDLLICDAPCTGSGTWSRTPEQLYYFKKERIDHHAQLQENICNNVIHFLNNEGVFLYITCSVFKNENERMVEFLRDDHNLKVQKMEMLKGYDKKADSLFAALLQKV